MTVQQQSPLLLDLKLGYRLINAASSTGRCNTIQCVDSTILPLENRSVWLYSVKT
jgi:hypothetical protein